MHTRASIDREKERGAGGVVNTAVAGIVEAAAPG